MASAKISPKEREALQGDLSLALKARGGGTSVRKAASRWRGYLEN